MKKLIKLFTVLSVATVTIVACKSEKIEKVAQANAHEMEQRMASSEYSQLTEEEGVLSFETVDYFSTLVNDEAIGQTDLLVDYINQSDFNSFGKENPESELFDDELMEAILNPDRIVKIEKWFILIDMEDEKVYTISADADEAYEKLVTMSDMESIETFSTTEDVLVMLKEDLPRVEFAFFCSESGVGARDDSHCYGAGTYSNASTCSGNGSVLLEHRKFGIYFKIQARAFIPNTPVVGWEQTVVMTFTSRKYKKTCKSAVDKGTGFIYVYAGTSPQVKHVISQGTRNYHRYHITLAGSHYGFGTSYPSSFYDWEADMLGGAIEIRVNM